ncbi:hypothetical protein NQ176_g3365 [Zarea fungicola]|uniref:Uncharacterized protein n=1 Tax=Zarea fungicola TaxID=93591 RepID=A0ACC1NK74_9HYPO|nr:hypothetical protein NQ176_g3365 [Lecanicillium fungicola]
MAPLPPDPYKILGVAKDAQTSEIRSSYRKLVLKCHPDKVQDPKLKEEKQNEFQRVQQAYELLNDDSERQKYDDKVRLEDLRRQMKEKQSTSSPKPSPKYSAEFEIRTPEMRSSGFKASPSPGKTHVFARYEDDYGLRDGRFESKTRSSSKRDTSFSERYSKRELEREKEREREREKDKDKDRERDRRRKEDDARRAAKISKETLKAEKKRQEKQRDRDIKRDAEDKLRQRFAKVSMESYDDEPSKSDRKRSTRKADDKAGRSSPRDEKPSLSSRPPLAASNFIPYTANDRIKFERAATYVDASRAPPAPLYRSSSYSGRSPYIPAAPSPPPTKKAFVMDDTDSDDNVRRSRAPSRRGSGDAARLSRERSYRKGSNEVLEDHFHSQTPTNIRLAAMPNYLSEWTKAGFEESMFLGAQVAARIAFCLHSNMDAQAVEAQRMMSLSRVDYK